MLNRIFNLIFPKICLHCGENLKLGENLICDNCRRDLIFRKGNLCPRCNTVLTADKCLMCDEMDYAFDKAFSAFKYSKTIKSLVHSIKYNETKKVGKLLGFYLAEYWKKFVKINDIDCVIPVPLHKVKKRMRGYNQSKIIGESFAKSTNFHFDSSLIKRIYFTNTQTKLTKLEREKNIKNAFEISNVEKIKNKKILIIDDVFTTGSTVNEISKILKKYSAEKIYVLTAARA